MMKTKIAITTMLMLILVSASFSQEKREREYGVKKHEVSKEAREFIADMFEHAKQIKWYSQVSEDIFSYEAKLIFKGSSFSVEFNKEGRLLNIEKNIGINDIDKSILNNIERYFSENFSKYKIHKIQIQYTLKEQYPTLNAIQYNDVAEDLLEDLIEKGINRIDDVTLSKVEIKYEIEITGKDKSMNNLLYEVIFDGFGKAESLKKVVLNPTENLEY